MRSSGRKLPRGRKLGAPLALALIIIALTAAVFTDLTSLMQLTPPVYRIKTAVFGSATIRTAVETHRRIERTASAFPTTQDLVRLGLMDSKRINDPWNTPYQLRCEDAFIRVTSAGEDRRFNTPDDIHDAFKPSDVERVNRL